MSQEYEYIVDRKFIALSNLSRRIGLYAVQHSRIVVSVFLRSRQPALHIALKHGLKITRIGFTKLLVTSKSQFKLLNGTSHQHQVSSCVRSSHAMLRNFLVNPPARLSPSRSLSAFRSQSSVFH